MAKPITALHFAKEEYIDVRGIWKPWKGQRPKVPAFKCYRFSSSMNVHKFVIIIEAQDIRDGKDEMHGSLHYLDTALFNILWHLLQRGQLYFQE